MRLTCTALALISLTGCGSFRADPENQKTVPSDRLLAYQQPIEGGSQLLVSRDVGMLGGGCYIAFYIDRKVAARIGIGEAASFHVPAGEHVVGIGNDTQDTSFCGRGSLRRELAVQVSGAGAQHLRIVSEAKSGFGIVTDLPPSQR